MSELRRRAVHASGVVVPLAYLGAVLTYREVQLLLVAGSILVIGLEIVRLRFDAVPGPLARLFDRLTREYEQTNVAGYALYTFSMTGVALVFEPVAAIPGMLMLTIADPISGELGSAEPGERKRLAVLIATFAICLVLALAVLWLLDPAASSAVRVAAAALGALGATIADGYNFVIADYVIDDNATIPPAAAVGIAAVLWLA
jgi:dolichol kinase